MNKVSLEEILAEVDVLPSLPTIVDELVRAMDKEDVSVDELVDGIAGDQALAARVLRVANSPFYGVQHKVSSIHDAVVVLGFRAIGSLVLAASVTGYFSPPAGYGFDLQGFWRHSIGAALAARALARKGGLDAETGFTAGLLHDIGRLMLVTRHTLEYADVMAECAGEDCPVCDAERRILGFDHAQVGEILARRWRLPAEIVRAVAQHHAPEPVRECSYADIAHVADVLAHALDLARTEQEMVPSLDVGAWRRLRLDGPTLTALLPGIVREHEHYSALLAAG